jgi:hypothetical protein
LGARIPLYGPLNCVVAADTAADWLTALLELELSAISSEAAYAIVQLARRTGDRTREVNEKLRNQASRALRAAGVDVQLIEQLQQVIPPERSDAVRMFGESLPRDLPLVSSANCLLSMTALTPDPEKVA